MIRVLAVYVPRCHDCGEPLPVWQQLLLGAVAVAIALGLLLGASRLLDRRHRRATADDLPALVERGLHMVDERERAAPGQTVHASIRGQLEYLRTVLRAGQAPSEDALDRLTLGVLAAREFETSDPQFAAVLFEINYRANRYVGPAAARRA